MHSTLPSKDPVSGLHALSDFLPHWSAAHFLVVTSPAIRSNTNVECTARTLSDGERFWPVPHTPLPVAESKLDNQGPGGGACGGGGQGRGPTLACAAPPDDAGWAASVSRVHGWLAEIFGFR
jgi:hypothetical protein